MASRQDNLASKEETIATIAKREAKDLREALSSTQDIMLPLLRFHLWAEQVLERLLNERFVRADRILPEARLTFAQKVALVHAFDCVPEAAVQALRRVNQLRNQCSHVGGKEIKAADIDILGQPLGGEYRELKRSHGEDLLILLVFTLAAIAKPFIAAAIRGEVEAFIAGSVAQSEPEEPKQ